MNLTETLIQHVTPRAQRARPVDICIGAHWTLVVLEVEGATRAGSASTLADTAAPPPEGWPQYTAAELVGLARSPRLSEASVGFAAINALLEVPLAQCVEVNAADILAERGRGRDVAIVGHFPFVPRLRECARRLWVLELQPRAGDLPAAQAAEILPQAEVVAVTGSTLLNHTFEGLAALWRPEAFVVMLGGTTPLSPLLFAAGVTALAGTLIIEPELALASIRQGATFRQIAGKRLVMLFR